VRVFGNASHRERGINWESSDEEGETQTAGCRAQDPKPNRGTSVRRRPAFSQTKSILQLTVLARLAVRKTERGIGSPVTGGREGEVRLTVVQSTKLLPRSKEGKRRSV